MRLSENEEEEMRKTFLRINRGKNANNYCDGKEAKNIFVLFLEIHSHKKKAETRIFAQHAFDISK